MSELPIKGFEREILERLRNNQVIVVSGPTGCGKTTKLPQVLLEAGYAHDGQIAVTEPRRVAAMSAAIWTAQLRGSPLGVEVGFKIRHRKVVDADTRIIYMTEGVLLREMLEDELLHDYSVLVLDEVHERGIHQDYILALVKRLVRRRPTLKVVIMSATMAEEELAAEFNRAPIIKIQGRQYPVHIKYLEQETGDPVETSLLAVPEVLREVPAGDLLVFLPDYASIRRGIEYLGNRLDNGTKLLVLYGDQSPEEQKTVVFGRDPNLRHVILSTNVAETSLTIDGVTAVIDCGLIKLKSYKPDQSLSTLKAEPHSQAGMEQRAGRAGRTKEGICYRMMTRLEYERRRKYTKPEILRMDLADVLLHGLDMGFSYAELTEFGWLSPPCLKMWEDALKRLRALGAVDRDANLTEVGVFMADLPLPPAMSKMIIEARRRRCLSPMLIIAASFSTRPILLRPPGEEEIAESAQAKFQSHFGDFHTVLDIFEAWKSLSNEDRESFCVQNYLHPLALSEIDAVSRQLASILREKGIPMTNGGKSHDLGKSIAAGLAANLLIRHGDEESRSYDSRHRLGIALSPGSALVKTRQHPKYVVCAEIQETRRVYALRCMTVPGKWLKELGIEVVNHHRDTDTKRSKASKRNRPTARRSTQNRRPSRKRQTA